MKSDSKYLFFLILLYFVFRLLIIFFSPGTISYELYRGTLARELIEGLKLPWGDYLTDPYSLAPFFNAFLTIPFFLLFGSTLFALKLVPFFWHLLSLIAWFFVFRSFFSNKQTFLILLFFVLAPPRIIEYFLANHGTHFELILWTALSLLVLNRLLTLQISIPLGGLLLGLLGGFSSFLTLTNLVTGVIILFYTAFALKQKKKIFYFLYAIAFLIGFFPWLLYNSQHAWAGLLYPKQLFFYEFSLDHLFSNFRSIFLQGEWGLKGLLGFEGLSRSLRLFLTFGYEGIYLIALLILLIRKWKFWKEAENRLDLAAFALIYQGLFFVLIVFSQHGWSDNYWFPLVPFMGMTIVLGCQKLKPFFKTTIISFCLLAGLIGNLILIRWGHFGESFLRQGYSYDELGSLMEYNFGHDLSSFQEKASKLLEGRFPPIKRAFYQALLDNLFVVHREEEIRETLAYINDVEPEFQSNLFEKFGLQLGIFLQFDSQRLADLLKEYHIPNLFYPEIYRGVMGGLDFCGRVALSVKQACFEGLGRNYSGKILQVESPYQQSYFFGLGRHFTSEWIYNPKMVDNFIQSFNSQERDWFYQGITKEIFLVEDPWMRQELLKKLAR